MALVQEGSLVPLIQLSITPVILISGLGGLMIAVTNRLGRIVDRTRNLAGQMRTAGPEDRTHLEQQIAIMYRRARLMRLSVTLTAASMLVSGLLIMVIFVSALADVHIPTVIVGCFATSVLLLVASLIAFIRDIFVSLAALGIEVKRAVGAPSPR
jgi:hypothetical protein